MGSKGYQSGLGAIIEGLNKGSQTVSKNRYERGKIESKNNFTRDLQDRKFKQAKMLAEMKAEADREKWAREGMQKGREHDQELAEEFPDQWSPIQSRSAEPGGNNLLPREELDRINQIYESIRQERSRRLKMKEKQPNAWE